MAPRLTPLDPVDAAWYHMDRAANVALVTGLTLTATPLDMARLRALFEQRLLPFARFRQRVVERGFPLATPHWEPDPAFDLDAHLHHIALPEPADMAALLQLVGDLASTPLDHDRPLWQLHLVDRFGAGSALVLRYHHCLADGTAMMALAAKLFDTEPDPPAPPAAPAPQASWLEPLFRPALGLLEQSMRAFDEVGKGVHQLTHPELMLGQLRALTAGVGTALMSVIKPADPRSPLKGSLGGRQRVAFSEPVPVPLLKAIGRATGTTVNDVLVAAVSGAVRQYLEEAGADPQQLSLRAVVPVDLRPRRRALELGNVFGLTFLDLPVGPGDALGRLARAKQGMDAIKHSPEATVFMNVLALFGQAPKPLEDLACDLFSSKATLVLTNVQGPRRPLYLAGAQIARQLFFVPHPVTLGLGVSLLSYNGEVTLGVISDAEVLAEPARIAGRFVREVAALHAAVMAARPAEPPAAAEAEPEPEGQAAPEPVAAPTIAAEAERCTALTRGGARCKNRALAGGTRCHRHS